MPLAEHTFQKLFLLIFPLVLFPGKAQGQYDLNRPSLLIRAEDGLPNHYFRGMIIDGDGFLWIGSYDGLARFDGTRITTFFHRPGDSTSLAHSAIASLAAGPDDGAVWVGTYGGLSIYVPALGRFRSYYHDATDPSSLRTNFIDWIYADRQGQAWVASGTQVLSRYDPPSDAFIHYHPKAVKTAPGAAAPPAKERIQSICQGADNDSLIWIGTNLRFFNFNKYSLKFSYEFPQLMDIEQILAHSDGYLYLLDGNGTLRVYSPTDNQVVRELKLKGAWHIQKMLCRSDEALWLSCNEGVAVMDTRSFTLSYPWANDSGRKKTYELDLAGPQGRLWSASPAGVKMFDPLTTQFQNYLYETSGAVHPYIAQKIAESPGRRYLYLNVNGGEGLYRFSRESGEWLLIPPPRDYGPSIFYGKDLTFSGDGQLLILESSEIFTLSADGRAMVSHPINKKLPKERNWLNCFADSRGYLWLGGAGAGLFRINLETEAIEALDSRFPGCGQARFRYAFYEDSRQNVWITNCTGFGFYSYERDSFFLFPYSEGGPNDNTFRRAKDFAEGRDSLLWVSNEEDGELGRVDLGRPEKGLFEKFSLQARVSDGSIPVKKGTSREIAALTKLAVDTGNHLWGISPVGLVRLGPGLSGLELYNEQDGLWWLDDELKVATVNQLEELSSGELVAGFRKGLSIFDPLRLQSSNERPRPYFTSFKVHNDEWPLDSSLAYTRLIHLGHEDNYFSFEFSAVGYTNPDNFRFQYKLEGIDEDWIQAGKRNYAAYTNVPGGQYAFLVKVANSDGLWNEEAAQIKLIVAIPWWQQLWFQGSLLLLLFIAAYAFYRYRLGQVRKAERLRSEFEKKAANLELTALRAQMNPHFLFNCLNSIDHYIIKNETRKASEYLNSFSRLIRLILQNSRNNYVNLKDELETLGLYLEMESLRFNHRFDYELRVSPDIIPQEADIPPMLIQPFVENAIWHGLMHKDGKGKVELDISKEGGFLKCIVQDNGIGRKRAAELRKATPGKKSMGMNITKDRIDIINKIYEANTRVRIIDLHNEAGEATGTRVELLIPV